MFSWNLLAFSMIQRMLAIWFLVPLPFLNPAGTSKVHGSHTVEAWLGEFWALLCEHLSWVQLCSSFNIFLALPFFGIRMKTDLFQACGHCWVFQICWPIECSTFTASSFRIWNSSTGIQPPSFALFVVMLPKAHLTVHSRMSGSRWLITLSWLSGSWRSFLYSSSMYSSHHFLISSSVRSIPFCPLLSPSLQEIFPWYL